MAIDRKLGTAVVMAMESFQRRVELERAAETELRRVKRLRAESAKELGVAWRAITGYSEAEFDDICEQFGIVPSKVCDIVTDNGHVRHGLDIAP